MDTPSCPAGPEPEGVAVNEAPKDLPAQIAAEFGQRPTPIKATTYIRKWDTNSKPVALMCEDGATYVVKALQAARADMGRVLVNEQIVARLGRLIHAPVPHFAFID